MRRVIGFLGDHRIALFRATPRIALVVVLAVSVAQVMAPRTYRVREGYATYQLEPALPGRGGWTIMPLGPAGVLRMKTHHTPVDLKVDLRFGDAVPSTTEARALLDEQPAIQRDAVDAFNRFLQTKVPWLLLFGAAAGVLVAGGDPLRPRRALLGIAAGAGAAALVTAVFVALTVATLDRTPRVSYEGLATNLPRVMSTVRQISDDSRTGLSGVNDFVRGLETVATQLDIAAGTPVGGESVTRALIVTDVHDNVVGVMLASSLAQSRVNPVSMVLVAGDQTSRGTDMEARLFAAQLKTGHIPVLLIGGNHEDKPAMTRFRRSGYEVLDGREVDVAGLTIYGVQDPAAVTILASSDEPGLAAADQALLARWKAGGEMPDILLVHDIRQAQSAIDWVRSAGKPLTVICGHTHVPAVTRDGSVTIIDGGTSGASGYEQVGRGGVPYTFQLVDFSRGANPRLLSVTTMTYTGLGGRSSADYVPIAR